MSGVALLWILFGINTLIYYYVGRAVLSQPKHNHPMLFWSGGMKWAAMVVPPSGYLALIVAGFFLTDSGWMVLLASIIAYWVFAVRTRIDEWF